MGQAGVCLINSRSALSADLEHQLPGSIFSVKV